MREPRVQLEGRTKPQSQVRTWELHEYRQSQFHHDLTSPLFVRCFCALKSEEGGRRRRSARGGLRKHQEVDHVRVEQAFSLKEPASVTGGSNKKVGEACYVTATIHNRRYYGTLVDQEALKAASMLYFQDAATGLEINQRMRTLRQRQQTTTAEAQSLSENGAAMENGGVVPMEVASTSFENTDDADPAEPTEIDERQVQKFRYVERLNQNDSYRVLLATYASVEAAAEEGDEERRKAIEAACRSGGNFVGQFYYQYEVRSNGLESDGANEATETRGLRMSMGFSTFLQNTFFPEWFPLANLEVGHQQVLDTLGMKKDSNGMVVWDESKQAAVPADDNVEATLPHLTTAAHLLIPMEPRSRYRVVVVGGGIAGLSCCLELFQACERDGVDLEVTLVEGRSRLGGRLWTDRQTFRTAPGASPVPVDLGASWIHGIDSNPLAAMAQQAKVDFVQTSEEVTMLCEGGKILDEGKDERAAALFDKLLDMAVETCWRDADGTEESTGGRGAVRWYASGFVSSKKCTDGNMNSKAEHATKPQRLATGAHRDSSDPSVDEAIGSVIAKGRLTEVATLSEEERRMLGWNIRNVEYALGAAIADLSMKFWDIDERHAFEGDHVILKQGYSCVVDHIYSQLKGRGERFTCMLESPVERIEYARKTSCNPYFCPRQRHKRFVELSDTCLVSFENGRASIPCDFVVSAVPLGVLKDSVREKATGPKLSFQPVLPFSKRDSIGSVGFGLLDKVYLQFPEAFWRVGGVLKDGQSQFGNASACNPHHYMFIDVGLILDGQSAQPPPILMTLISGNDAVASECLAEEELIATVVQTLATLFSGRHIPKPIAHKVTRWGRDRFSRGSYSFLGPGTTDHDFRVLQSPINGNGDSILLDGSETMRLFFAGEHTTSLHPSMAHGAMLSGYRAAKEVMEAMAVSLAEDADRTFPLSLFRHKNPKAKLTCTLCHMSGSRVREGSLLAFRRGARDLLVHNNCAENSPEVGVKDGVWQNVVRACNRGKAIECSLCGQVGATIGCTVESCTRSYHFSCAEDTGWRFEEDGKEFSCDLHRTPIESSRKISLEYWLLNATSGTSLTCALCGMGSDANAGEMLAVQKGQKRIVAHECCVRFTSTIKVVENTSSRFEKDFENVFEAVDGARTCERCSRGGATIECTEPACSSCYHFHCARSLDWDFASDSRFRCLLHRNDKGTAVHARGQHGSDIQHTLFTAFGAGTTEQVPANMESGMLQEDPVDEDSVSDAVAPPPKSKTDKLKLAEYNGDALNMRLVNASRESQKHKWNLTLEASVDPTSNSRVLTVASGDSGNVDGLNVGDVVCTINGVRVGASVLDSVAKVMKVLAQEIEIFMEVCDGPSHDDDDPWAT